MNGEGPNKERLDRQTMVASGANSQKSWGCLDNLEEIWGIGEGLPLTICDLFAKFAGRAEHPRKWETLPPWPSSGNGTGEVAEPPDLWKS